MTVTKVFFILFCKIASSDTWRVASWGRERVFQDKKKVEFLFFVIIIIVVVVVVVILMIIVIHKEMNKGRI